MTVKQAYKRQPTIDVVFYTEAGTFNLKYNTTEDKADNGSVLGKGNMSSAIISLTTDNNMSNDSATFTLNVASSERFDRILSPNDIVIIKINPGVPNKVKNDVVMVGMVSDIKRIGEYDSSSIVYQVNGNDMMAALMQLKLGTIQEVASLLGKNGWMMGLGGLAGASTYLEKGTDNHKDDTNSSDYIKKQGKKSKGSVLVSAFRGAAYYSNFSDNELSVATSTDYAIGSWVYIDGYGLAKVKAHLGTNQKLLQLVTSNTMLGQAPKIFVNLPAKEVKKFGTQFKTIYSFNNKPTTNSTSTSSKSKVKTDGSQGLVLQGQGAASIAKQLITWFLKLHTDYRYNGGKNTISDFITTDLTSWSDESLMDPTPIMSYEGSLRQLISDNQAKPYNEFFSDYTSDGKMKFVMRKTPFEPEDWSNLYSNAVQLYPTDVLEETTGVSKNEVYSVFLANMPSNIVVESLSALLSFPEYFPELAKIYGYSMLQVENPYIFAFKQDVTDGGSDSTDPASGGGASISSATINDIAHATMAWTSNTKSNTTAANLDAFIKKSNPTARLNGTGKYFIEAGHKTGLNPVIILAFAALESAWGNSQIGQANNFFGIGAFDTNPNNGLSYSNATIRDGIISGARFIKNDYFNQGQTTLHSLFNNNGVHQYSTTPDEDKRIASTVAAYYNMFPIKTSKSDKTKDADSTNTEVKKSDSSNSNSSSSDNNGNSSRLKKYTTLLANWYGDNASFISGEIRVLGNPDYRVGQVLVRYDNGESVNGSDGPIQIDYYIESVTQEFNLTSGYTTTLGVTRGLVHTIDRFAHWNSWLDPLSKEQPGNGNLQFFNGGLFGELTIRDNTINSAKTTKNSKGNDSGKSNDTKGVGSGDDYPAKWKNISPDSTADSWGYYSRECTSFVAWRLSQEGKTGFSHLGNAITWKSLSGLPLQRTPKVGDCAWFDSTDAPGAYGHVAYVAKVDGDTVYVEEYNYNYTHSYHTRVLPLSRVTGFLRFPNK